MTIIFSAATENFIVMTVDGAITETSNGKSKYKTGTKSYCKKGIGCVATWGERRGNQIGLRLLMTELSQEQSSFEDLDQVVESYLKKEYEPHLFEGGLDDVGYHIAGFDRQGKPHLYHRYWGVPRPQVADACQDYHFSDHTPSPEIPLQLVYNGRNDIAKTIIDLIVREIQEGKSIRYDLKSPFGIACLSDFVTRTAAGLTREVSPPFTTYIIAPENRIATIYNNSFAPIEHAKIATAIELCLALPNSDTMTIPTLDMNTLFSPSPSAASVTEFQRITSGGTVTVGTYNSSRDIFD